MSRTEYLTPFALTSDGNTTPYPSDSDWPTSSNQRSQATDRYSALGSSRISYPIDTKGFNASFIRFTILDAYGGRIRSAPKIFLPTPPALNLTNSSEYSKGEGIFGGGSTLGSKIFEDISNSAAAEATGSYGYSAAEAVKYSIKKAAGSVLGFVGSAGLNNLDQYEFNTRQTVNPMSQMLYKGPQFRRYQLPFSLKPKNLEEARACEKAVSAFRLASSPSVPDREGDGIVDLIGEGSTFTFGYPHLVQFDIMFEASNGGYFPIYRSKPSAIESVSVDYGSQKMTFFSSGHPSEATMSISLIEITPRTLGDAKTEASGYTKIR